MDMITILVAVACLVIGGGIGWFLGTSLSKSAKKLKGLRRELDQANEELLTYKDQVRQHFSRTAELVNDMTNSYRAVHEHLANSARNLCDGPVENIEMKTPELLVTDNSPKKSTTSPGNDAGPSAVKTEIKDDLAAKAQAASEAAAYDARTLFEKIGGDSKVEIATDALLEKIKSDKQVGDVYKTVSRAQWREFIVFAFGGEDNYSGKELHKLNRAHFEVIKQHLNSVLGGNMSMAPNLITSVLDVVEPLHAGKDENFAVDGVAKASLKSETPQVYH